MKRNINSELEKWKDKYNRKPLLIYGPRHLGKTYSILEFGKENFDNLVYFNFEENPSHCSIFEYDLDPVRILSEIQKLTSILVTPQTLLIFDEIQNCKKAITSLKYFCEWKQEIPIIATGNLITVSLLTGYCSFPVGKIDILYMNPLTFDEFLLASGKETLKNKIEIGYESNIPLSELDHTSAIEYFHQYLSTGGYPEVVENFTINRNYDLSEIAKCNIIEEIDSDLSKFCVLTDAEKNRMTYDSVFSQLEKGNKKFEYSQIRTKATETTYEESLNWLIDTRLVTKVYKANEGKIALFFYRDLTSYKIYVNDVGLLTSKTNLLSRFIAGELNNGLTENIVIQSLTANGFNLYYRESKDSSAFNLLFENNGNIIPIEFKAGFKAKSRSLTLFCNKYNIKSSIRISTSQFGFENNIRSVPLYAVWCIKKEY
jgi:predicted AAA+ superfamily ATPase